MTAPDPRRLGAHRWLLVGAIVVLLLPASLSASIVPRACIDGIGLWDDSANVVSEWGKPIRIVREGPDRTWYYSNGSVMLTRWGYKPHANKLIVLVITTRDPGQRTAAGIGVGSTRKALHAAFPRLHCSDAASCSEGNYGWYTVFTLKNSRVTAVSVSLDSGYDDAGILVRPDPLCRKS